MVHGTKRLRGASYINNQEVLLMLFLYFELLGVDDYIGIVILISAFLILGSLLYFTHKYDKKK